VANIDVTYKQKHKKQAEKELRFRANVTKQDKSFGVALAIDPMKKEQKKWTSF
jgi:hypothetical protein